MAHAAKIQVTVDSDEAVCRVIFDSVLFYRRQEGQTADERYRSSSIAEIRNLEAKALGIDGRRVVETSQPRVLGGETDRLRTARSIWTYNYGAVRRFESSGTAPSSSLLRQGA